MSNMSRRILVVDDEEDIQTFLCDVFRDAGWTVDSAQNGLEALERIEQCRPDLVLLDIVMPVVDGWGVLERLRQTATPPRVLVLSGVTDSDRALQAGASGHLAKPFEVEELLEACARLGGA